MELTHSDVQKILQIIDEAEHLEELELVYGDVRLHVRRHGVGEQFRAMSAPAVSAAPRAVPATAPGPAAATTGPVKTATQTIPEGLVGVRAPMLGTFYRAPSPGEKPFVEIGQMVKAEDTVCLIEVMKLFNSIKAGVDGTVVQILAENSGLVEYNQVLVLVEPLKKK